jgi:signal peptidase II
LDQVTKSLALASLGSQKRKVIGNLLALHLVFNSGAAFSIAPSRTTLLTAFSIAVAVLILFRAKDFTNRLWILAAGLVVGGIAGNLIDRIVRTPGALAGSVVDWIELPHWPTFNLADSSIVLGAVLAAVLVLREIPSHTNPDHYRDESDENGDTQFPSKGGHDE